MGERGPGKDQEGRHGGTQSSEKMQGCLVMSLLRFKGNKVGVGEPRTVDREVWHVF